MVFPYPIFLPFFSKTKSLWEPYHGPSVSVHSCIESRGIRKKLPQHINYCLIYWGTEDTEL